MSGMCRGCGWGDGWFLRGNEEVCFEKGRGKGNGDEAGVVFEEEREDRIGSEWIGRTYRLELPTMQAGRQAGKKKKWKILFHYPVIPLYSPSHIYRKKKQKKKQTTQGYHASTVSNEN